MIVTKKEIQGRWFIIIILFILTVPQLFYMFRHPEMTQTQLFSHFFDAYKEFFRG